MTGPSHTAFPRRAATRAVPSGPLLPDLFRALRCVSTEPALAGLLLLGAPPEIMPTLGEWLATLCRSDRPSGGSADARVVVLFSGTTEDDVWGRQAVTPDGNGATLRFSASPLVLERETEQNTVVLVPDLASVSQAAARAAVVLVGADAAHLERDGRSAAWRPRATWLVACGSTDIVRLSPHLLDRFPFRLRCAGLGVRYVTEEAAAALLAAELDRAEPPAAVTPVVTEAALDRVLLWTDERSPGARRSLCLGRLARAMARLDAAPSVDENRVDQAAALLGLRRPDEIEEAPSDPRTEEEPSPTPWTPPSPSRRGADGGLPDLDPAPPVATPGPADELGVLQFPAGAQAAETYPEDTADGVDLATLRTPWQRRTGVRRLRGVPIGTEPAHDLTDLAVVATIFEAAKFQAIRRAAIGTASSPGHLLISPSDLRAFRRAPEPGQLLVMLLDHTVHRDWNWYLPLAPYLRWANAERAAICVVEAGGRDTPNELRAELFSAPSLRDPRIDAALQRPVGRATPLAHALSLAARELQRRLQHGRAMVEQAWLVVVTDGRGNVPLVASLAGALSGPVGREGVHDALAAAGPIRDLSSVNAVVIDPGRGPYRDLVFDLADALGGVVERGRD